MLFLLCAGGYHPVQVAGKHVNLDIELSAGLDIAQGRLLPRVGDDVDRGVGFAVGFPDLVDGQRNAVESDGALRRDESGETGRNPEDDAV